MLKRACGQHYAAVGNGYKEEEMVGWEGKGEPLTISNTIEDHSYEQNV